MLKEDITTSQIFVFYYDIRKQGCTMMMDKTFFLVIQTLIPKNKGTFLRYSSLPKVNKNMTLPK